MRKEQILKRLQEAEELKDCVITESKSKRLDTKDAWCISIFPNDSNTGVIMYRGCFSEDDPVQDVLNALKGKELREKLLHKAEDMNLGEFLSNLYVEVYNFNTVKNKLGDFVYIQKDDIVLVLCLLLYRDSEGLMSTKVSHGLLGLKDCNLNDENLIKLALGNSAVLFDIIFRPLEQFMLERNMVPTQLKRLFIERVHNPESSEYPNLYILSNANCLHGASLIFSEELQKILFKSIGPFYVIPSSIHEVLLLAKENYCIDNSNALKSMVEEVNNTMISADVLSENVYYFDGNKLILC